MGQGEHQKKEKSCMMYYVSTPINKLNLRGSDLIIVVLCSGPRRPLERA